MSRTEPNLHAAFIEFSRQRLLDQYWPRLRSCVELLSDDQVWWRPNEASNSIGNLMLHLNGNIQQWLILRTTPLHHETAARRGPGFLSRTGQNWTA